MVTADARPFGKLAAENSAPFWTTGASGRDMCGIAGIVGLDAGHLGVERMAAYLAHRGPDNTGLFSTDGVAFAHQRLSIVDLDSRSNQPMTKGHLTIVFNGEIYNFREIKKRLGGASQFLTSSDTEVVLEAWRQWGPRCLETFRGMFAFAIHDSHTGRTHIVRDPFGIKPVFYRSLRDGQLAFASELKALETISRADLTLSYEALAASLLYVWIPESLCVWKEVRKLEPGHYLTVDVDGTFTVRRYWNPLELVSTPAVLEKEADAISALDRCLKDSVDAHLVADVPVNAFLSGGLDSSLIVAMARRELDKLDCYTIKFSEQDKKHEAMPDDAFFAAKVAKAIGVNLNIIEVRPNLAELLPKIVYHLDEPIGDSAAINTFLICDAAHQNGVKVLLSGMGADELFAGYRKHLANRIAAMYRQLPPQLRERIISPLIKRIPVSSSSRGLKLARWAQRFVDFADLPEADAFLRSYTYYSPDELVEHLQPRAALAIKEMVEYHHSIFRAPQSRSLIDRMCFTDTQMFMTSLNLTYTDRASMAASTEVRVPFIDKSVVRLAFQIDSRLKIHGTSAKYVLKGVAERWLPREIVHRPKSSFTMPLRAWLKSELRELIDDYVLSPQGLAGRDIFDARALREIVDADRRGYADNAQRIWQFLTLEQWLRIKGV